MNLSFSNGTAEQQALARAVVADCRYDFTQVAATVVISWEDLAQPLSHTLWAGLTSAQADGSYLIRLRSDLGDSSKPAFTQALAWGGPNRDWFYEILTHELGHVMQFVLQVETLVVPLFGGATSDWATGVESPSAFPRMIREGDAETFKDVFSPHRMFDNRTGWHLPSPNFQSWLAAYSTATSEHVLVPFRYNGE